mgnify:FL=1|tara:strand:+ start:14557 stop:15015 length:459 start_codon:yes stop_codon:yes gene_type:complete
MNRLQEIGAELAQELEIALPIWVEDSIRNIYQAWTGEWPQAMASEARLAGESCRTEIGPVVRELLESDVTLQQVNPMSVLRSASQYPTEVLRRNNVPHVQRDEYLEATFPEDVYGLTPTAFLDFGQAAHELGIAWGAAKAHSHLAQRRETKS